MLNCKLGEIPLKYLGIPISDSKLGMGAFTAMVDKVAKRVPPWRGKHMSSGGENDSMQHMPSQPTHIYYGFLSAPQGDS
jgi:hypothetical protein